MEKVCDEFWITAITQPKLFTYQCGDRSKDMCTGFYFVWVKCDVSPRALRSIEKKLFDGVHRVKLQMVNSIHFSAKLTSLQCFFIKIALPIVSAFVRFVLVFTGRSHSTVGYLQKSGRTINTLIVYVLRTRPWKLFQALSSTIIWLALMR